MKTTLDISDDLLRAVQELAQRESKTVDEVISMLVRQALAGSGTAASRDYAHGVASLPSLPRRDAPVVTLGLVNSLRDQES